MERVPTLTRDKTKVVNAKADRPNGAGLAKLLFGALRTLLAVNYKFQALIQRTGTDQAGSHHQMRSIGSRGCWSQCEQAGYRLCTRLESVIANARKIVSHHNRKASSPGLSLLWLQHGQRRSCHSLRVGLAYQLVQQPMRESVTGRLQMRIARRMQKRKKKHTAALCS
jgi:hypothetical protein